MSHLNAKGPFQHVAQELKIISLKDFEKKKDSLYKRNSRITCKKNFFFLEKAREEGFLTS